MTNHEYFSRIYHDTVASSASWRIPKRRDSQSLEPRYRIALGDAVTGAGASAYLSRANVLYLYGICSQVAAQHMTRPLRGRPLNIPDFAREFASPFRTGEFKGMSVATLLSLGFTQGELKRIRDFIGKDKTLSEDRNAVLGLDSVLEYFNKQNSQKINEVTNRYADTDGTHKIFASSGYNRLSTVAEVNYGVFELIYCESAPSPFLLHIKKAPSHGEYASYDKYAQPAGMMLTVQELIDGFLGPMYEDVLKTCGK